METSQDCDLNLSTYICLVIPQCPLTIILTVFLLMNLLELRRKSAHAFGDTFSFSQTHNVKQKMKYNNQSLKTINREIITGRRTTFNMGFVNTVLGVI